MKSKSNGYIVFYTVALTVVCGSLLALASLGLKDFKDANIAFDLKKNILATTMDISGKNKKEIEKLYSDLVKEEFLVDTEGKVVKTEKDINLEFVKEEYSKAPQDRLLPVYKVATVDSPNQVAYYVFPMYGFGLWDYIWGFMSLDADLATVKGSVFGHKGETPGLGARIASNEIQDRYEGKQVFDGATLKPVEMAKGEGNSYDDDPYTVDGMSGATITARGLNKMLNDYLNSYLKFIEKEKGGTLTLAE